MSLSNNDDLFYYALKFVLKWEGGYVNNPNDNGGATNKGVTQGTYNAYRALKKLPVQNVKYISDIELRDIYKTRYWDAAGCNQIKSSNLSIIVFDTAVNMGVDRSKRILQKANWDIKKYLDLREALYKRFASVKGQEIFLRGWLNRLDSLRLFILNGKFA